LGGQREAEQRDEARGLARENAAALAEFISLGESLALMVELGDDAPRWLESRQGYRKSPDTSVTLIYRSVGAELYWYMSVTCHVTKG